MKKIDVVCGILIQNEKCLIAKRKTGDSVGKFEFPGGKVEKGETQKEALIRELKEELNIDVDQLHFLANSIDFQNGKEIHLSCFYVYSSQIPKQCIVHSEFVWTTPEHIYDYDFFESDRSLVQKLTEKWPCIKKPVKPKS